VVAVGVLGPEDELDRPSAEVGVEAVVGDRCVDGRYSDGELVEGQLDVDRGALLWCPEGLAEAEAFVEGDEAPEVVGVDVDRRVPEWELCGLGHGCLFSLAQAALRWRRGFFAAVTAASKARKTASAALGRTRTVRMRSACSP
jgi:hypothetical protein